MALVIFIFMLFIVMELMLAAPNEDDDDV